MRKPFRIFPRKKIIPGLLFLLAGWIVIDLYYPFKRDISKIDARETARMEGAMWRSYYEKKKLKLFFQSAELIREEFHFPFWRSNRAAYYAAKAAFVFKDGHNRSDYDKALPYLKKYYGLVNDISITPFSSDSAAMTELEWWIIRRERDMHPPAEWENWLAATASVMYHLPADSFREYAKLRVEAMLLRDEKGDSITETDWHKINDILAEAWQSFATGLQQKK
ncbi:MAG: hypothetical protein Q8941_16105 [Bacteroidota bacterium]|nr:hypothetical protein [Bacteroidota bacterium]